ncbi:hypothetical protein NQT65_18535 [Pseudoalteromonas agarivorans]|uniref:hypothetical protein n=1 Tax=Pseudoalteromonas agarivorans TaxID=176102 RepID=UPI002117CE37|nr:hypothetical protein [Pseudoalteromonas agarivorans]MCQ8822190.1 hypothetical protein [Pseudoalteromonas agarivorans]
MKKTLYIHIGTGKTGTTALQDFFLLNSDKLEESGVKYAKSGLVKNNHHLLCRNYLRKDEAIQSDIVANLEALNQEINGSELNTFLISSEYFPGLQPDEISELATIIEARIVPIVYLRRQDEFLESWYAQIVKAYKVNSNIYSLKNRLINEKIFDYKYLTGCWEKVNAQNEIIVRPYEKDSFYNNNIFDDFINALGLNIDDKFDFPKKDPNPSLKPNQIVLGLEMYDYCSEEQKNIIFTYFEGVEDNSKFFLSTEERNEIIDEHNKINNYVAQRYLNKERLFKNNSAKVDGGGESIFSTSFIEDFIISIYIYYPEKMKKIESALITFLKHKSVFFKNENNKELERKLLRLALIVRPRAPHVVKMLKESFERKAQ